MNPFCCQYIYIYIYSTLTNESLLLSEDHLVYARKCGSDEFNPM